MAKHLFILDGTVGCGKSNLFRSLKSTFKSKNIPVTFLEEPNFNKFQLGNVTLNPLEELYKKGATADTYLCMQILICQILSNYYENNKINTRVVILDRWLKGCSIFHEPGKKNGLLENPAFLFLQEFVNHKQDKFLNSIPGEKKIHLCFLSTDHETTGKQVILRKRAEETEKGLDFWVQFSKDFKEIALNQNNYEKIDSYENLKSYITEQILSIEKSPENCNVMQS